MMNHKKSALIGLLLVTVTFGVYATSLFIPQTLREPVEVQIRKGMSFSEVLTMLHEKGLVRDRNLVLLVGRIGGKERNIKQGFYRFAGSLSPYGLLRKLLEGRVVEMTVTIPEGFNIWQIARRLAEAEIMTEEHFLSLADDRAFLEEMNIGAPSLEGYLFPETYRFPKGMEPKEIVRTMVDMMRSQFTAEMTARAQEIGFSENDILSLASIIEKEAKIDEERPLIAAVFHNRLSRGIPLQADPTSVYGFKDISSGISYDDLKRKSPYNTYQIPGLPVGPIASPGLKSIHAALYPEDVDYLFFVSRNDGHHHFSRTEAEHRRAIRRFRVVMNERR